MYHVKPNFMNANQIVVTISINSQLTTEDTSSQIYSIEFNILDTLNTKLVKDNNNSGGIIKIPFNLVANSKYDFQIYFTVDDCTFAQKLKGTLTYMLKSATVSSVQEKIDFKLNLSCSSYLVQSSCDSNKFTDYLSSGELSYKQAAKFELKQGHDFKYLISKLCVYFNFTVVELISNCASLFASTMKHQPICLLVKLTNDDTLTIDGKSVNGNLVTNIVEECKNLLVTSD